MTCLGPRMLHSGPDRKKYFEVIWKEKAAALIHATTAKSPKIRAYLQEHPDIFCGLDPGYTKTISLPEYIQLLHTLEKEMPDAFAWYLNYDEIGMQKTSDANFEVLRAACPTFRDKIIWVFQCRWGSDAVRRQLLERLQSMCQHLCTQQSTPNPKLIAIGGLVPVLKNSVAHASIILQEIDEVLSLYHPFIQAHILGPASKDIIFLLHTYPWVASIDSSKWLIGWKAQEILLWSGEQLKAKDLRLFLKPEECAAINIRVLNSWLQYTNAPYQHPGEWLLPRLAPPSSADTPHQLETIRRFFVRKKGRKVVVHQISPFQWNGTLQQGLYLPLFTINGREYALMSQLSITEPTLSVIWAVVWDVFPNDLTASLLLMIEGKVKTGNATHTHPTTLCYYHFETALALARSFVTRHDMAA